MRRRSRVQWTWQRDPRFLTELEEWFVEEVQAAIDYDIENGSFTLLTDESGEPIIEFDGDSGARGDDNDVSCAVRLAELLDRCVGDDALSEPVCRVLRAALEKLSATKPSE